jgi:alanyl-tRNA synthetase
MQFDRDASGKLTPLPKPSIDTGMGLERVASVLQGVISNYETDLFTPLIKRAAELTGTSLQKELSKEAHTKSAASLRVIADHSRAATFLISDGVIPANDGRGYVLRKIIRRAITHGRLLGQTKPFLHQMVFAVRDLMQDAFPELNETVERASKAVLSEEARFGHTLGAGLQQFESFARQPIRNKQLALLSRLERERPELKDALSQAFREAARLNDDGVLFTFVSRDFGVTRGRDFAGEWRTAEDIPLKITGQDAFMLYDTFGVPPDYIEDLCRDRGIEFERAGFSEAMEEQKARARASWKGAAKQTANPAYQPLPKSEFEGYRQTRSDGCEVLAIIHNGQGVQGLKAGEEGEVILDHTPFYAESGGQVADRGWLVQTGRHLPTAYPETRVPYFGFQDSPYLLAEVNGCYYPIQGVRAHQIIAKLPIRVGDRFDAVVDAERRAATMRNHTATHLLHAGLREVLGKHVKQAGSLVAPNHLRFDFSHFTAVADEELQDIEDIINRQLLRNQKVETIVDVPIDVAVNEYHAMALFGEKYGDKVRVVKIGDFSTELCGGTHTAATGEIGLIKILKEGSVSSGVRRVEAVTGEGSLAHFRMDHELETFVSSIASPTPSQKTRRDGAPAAEEGTGSPAEALKAELEKKDAEIKRLTRELDQVRMKSASSSTANIGDKVKEVKGVKVLTHRVDNLERAQLRTLVDQLRDKIGSGVVVLGSASNGNVSLIVGVTKDLTSRVQAGKVIGAVAQKVGGKGGGRPDLAEAGGKDPGALDAALDGAYGVVEGLLA